MAWSREAPPVDIDDIIHRGGTEGWRMGQGESVGQLNEWKLVAAAVGPYLAKGVDPDLVAEEVIRGLASAGVLTIELDTPNEIDSDGTQHFSDHSAATEIRANPGDGVVHQGVWEWTYEQAVEVARQWLSAASVAVMGRA